jgi:putative hydrolase of HD superfamily
MDRAKSVIEYYVLNNKLKNVIRTGWKNWKVNRERIESVAEHVYGCQALAIAMYSQYQYDINLEKVIYMLAIHELEEIIIGDLTYWQISSSDKLKSGHEAIKVILKDLLNKETIEQLILEFDERKTKEAKFAYHIDKLECDIQCKLYGEENCVDINHQEGNKVYLDPRVQELLKQENGDWAKMWIEYDRSKQEDDKNFLEVLNYVKDNKISR